MKNYKTITKLLVLLILLTFSSCLSDKERYERAKEKCDNREYVEFLKLYFEGYSYDEIQKIDVVISGTHKKKFRLIVDEKLYYDNECYSRIPEKFNLKDSVLLVFSNKEKYLLTDFKYHIDEVYVMEPKFICNLKELKINGVVRNNATFIKKE